MRLRRRNYVVAAGCCCQLNTNDSEGVSIRFTHTHIDHAAQKATLRNWENRFLESSLSRLQLSHHTYSVNLKKGAQEVTLQQPSDIKL